MIKTRALRRHLAPARSGARGWAAAISSRNQRGCRSQTEAASARWRSARLLCWLRGPQGILWGGASMDTAIVSGVGAQEAKGQESYRRWEDTYVRLFDRCEDFTFRLQDLMVKLLKNAD